MLGDVICFEVAYDEVVRDTVTGGAQLLVVQTNNATFNEAEARQQMAMVRLRAVEHGRAGVDGLHGRRVRVRRTRTGGYTMPPGSTPGGRGAADAARRRTYPGHPARVWPEVALAALAVAALVGAAVLRRRQRVRPG